jgi:hypothetical protein
MNEGMSDLVAVFVLSMSTFYAVWLSLEFSCKSKLHLLWTIPVGFFGCFVAMAIFSLVVSQLHDFLFISTVCAVFLPLPLWRMLKRRKEAALPTEQTIPKDAASSSPLESLKNLKSNLDLIKKNKVQRNGEVKKVKTKTQTERIRRNYSRKSAGFKKLEIGDRITFDYTNANYETSTRRVHITELDGVYIKGVDLDKHATRTFRSDRINGGIINMDTGEVFYV